ncbi:hypothetical protein PoB_006352200 [Plakobranchus ocellatus]|uniref:Uncharacterized protein n=1 Tax=Plakobranchus ocellatus TaxID=259542 RepID=A0AAV4CYN2_9GAST|nr:hypothetical protein PoB_006352200 [Plakobranchus ocellatus]
MLFLLTALSWRKACGYSLFPGTPGLLEGEEGEEDDLGHALPEVDFKAIANSFHIMQRGCNDKMTNTLAKLETLLESHY